MDMTYENVARCPICGFGRLAVIEHKTLPDLGSVVVCKCAECGQVSTFSADCLRGSAKYLAEASPNHGKQSSNNEHLEATVNLPADL